MKSNKMNFGELRRFMSNEAIKGSKGESKVNYAVSDLFYDWNTITKMKQNECLLWIVSDGCTHLTTLDQKESFKGIFNNTRFFQITCAEELNAKQFDNDRFIVESL